MTKKVLFIAPNFPPVGGPGTNRSLQFVRYLTAMGYEIHVVTAALEEIGLGLYPRDDSQLALVPESVKITRLPVPDLRRVKRVFRKLRLYRLVWFFLFPWVWESYARWPRVAFGPIRAILEAEQIPLVYTSSGPFALLFLGARLKKKLNVKWVADLRDPYTDGYNGIWPSKLHWHGCRMVERYLLRKADRVIVTAPALKRLYLHRNVLAPSQVEVITNGF